MSIEEHERKAHEYDQIIWDVLKEAGEGEGVLRSDVKFSVEVVRAAVQKLRDSKYDRP